MFYLDILGLPFAKHSLQLQQPAVVVAAVAPIELFAALCSEKI
jgi:hypothetical protein